MPIRALESVEEQTREVLASLAGEVALLMPTATGLKKSILDATIQLRSLLKEAGLHDYSTQSQGDTGKVLLKTVFLGESNTTVSTASLYRPRTKQGDPRIWFRGLSSFAGPDEILGVFLYEGVIYLVNLSRITVDSIRGVTKTDLSEFLEQVRSDKDRISDELLNKLRIIAANGPLRAICEGDTAVGRTLEHALGISQNPSKQPDYLGIELKAYRGKSKQENRAGLFSQVPNWSMSRLKSSADFLREFGYERRGLRRLNCTVSARIANSQGLRFRLDMDEEVLHEYHQPTNLNCAEWDLPLLHARLLQKHKETFWIRVESTVSGGIEYFGLESVRHTEKPSIVQFDALLADGSVTMDHVIKETLSGGAKDQGYLFKLNKRDLPVLFAQPRDYLLRDSA